MVKTIQQASRIQERRVSEGKRGFARAVRRFVNKNTKDWYGAQAMKFTLPFNVIIPVVEEVSNVEV